MTKHCPLSKNIYCVGSNCALAGDKDGNCLIHKVLEAFVDGEFEFEVSSPERNKIPKFRSPTVSGNFCPWDYYREEHNDL